VLRECSHESPGERILKIGPNLPKLLSNIKELTFLEHSVFYQSICTTLYVRYNKTYLYVSQLNVIEILAVGHGHGCNEQYSHYHSSQIVMTGHMNKTLRSITSQVAVVSYQVAQIKSTQEIQSRIKS